MAAAAPARAFGAANAAAAVSVVVATESDKRRDLTAAPRFGFGAAPWLRRRVENIRRCVVLTVNAA